MSQKGFAPIVIVLALLTISGLIIGGVLYIKNSTNLTKRAIPALTPENNQESKVTLTPDQIGEQTKKEISRLIYTIFVIGGRTGSTVTDSVEYYNPALNQWKAGPKLPTYLADHAAAAINDKIYIFGGTIGIKTVDSVFMLDPQTNQWISKKPLPMPLSGGRAISLGGKIYVLGGRNLSIQEIKRNRKVFIYDPTKDIWTTGSLIPSNTPEYDINTCAGSGLKIFCPRLGDKVYTLVYDTTTDKWDSLPTEGRSKTGFAAAVGEDNILQRVLSFTYDINGAQSSVLSIYNPQTDSLSTSYSIVPKVIQQSGIASAGDYFFITGGTKGTFSGDPPFAEVYALNSRRDNDWIQLAPLNIPRKDHAVAVLPILYQMDVNSLGAVSGKAFADNNSNKKLDPGDKPISGVAIELDSDIENSNGEYTVISSTTTDNEGKFEFKGMQKGSYYLFVRKSPIGLYLVSPQNLINIESNENIENFDLSTTP